MEGSDQLVPENYYTVLGLCSNSSDHDIRRAYRKLAMQWHPDKWTKSPELCGVAKRKFQQIQEAYSVLSDSKKRKMYDLGLYDPDEEEDEGFADFVEEMASLIDKTRREERQYSMEELQSMFWDMAQSFEIQELSTSSEKQTCWFNDPQHQALDYESSQWFCWQSPIDCTKRADSPNQRHEVLIGLFLGTKWLLILRVRLILNNYLITIEMYRTVLKSVICKRRHALQQSAGYGLAGLATSQGRRQLGLLRLTMSKHSFVLGRGVHEFIFLMESNIGECIASTNGLNDPRRLQESSVPVDPNSGLKCGGCPSCNTPCTQSPPSLPPPSPPPPSPKKKSKPSPNNCPPPPESNIYMTGPPGNLYPVDSNYSSASRTLLAGLSLLVGYGFLSFLALISMVL
ncbi:hypothetical protein POM88_018234 [Heracleum sosnowskyi]|uniref:J domain-containing protein n=1 Tax=Heracleum sosnowskyi TaxID=360622 RepID=A0AAD8ISG9_9APIA|nr:hypothetical protein POM88_018234 [Heracleum sosnowskyi]